MAARDSVTSGPTVHQALYGYEDGHRLLVSSTDLANSDQRLLLRQTDSPDAGRQGWKELLAGFPLPSGRFAWCLTWPAPEMPRPGCVWTHALIFEPKALVEVGMFSPKRAFRRPQGPRPELSPYRKPFALPSAEPSLTDSNGKLREVLATVAWAFFDPPTRPVRIGRVALDEEPRHRLLMSLWEEGWPELRGVMSLADAPHAIRELAGRPFDLQLQSSVRRVAGSEERVIDGLLDREPPRWARVLAEEALQPGGLMHFLAAYGPAMPAHRDSVVPLTQTWLAWQDSNASQVLAQLQKSLPEPDQGRTIKEALLDPRKRPAGCSRSMPEEGMLAALVADESLVAVNLGDLRLPERIVALLNSAPAGVGAVLDAMSSKETPAGALVLDGLCSADTKLLKKWLKADAAGLPKLLRLRPDFASNPAVSGSLKPDELWEAIRRVRGARQRVDIAAAVVLGGGSLDPRDVSAAWKGSTVPIVKRLAESGAGANTLGRWLDVMEPTDRQGLAQEKDQRPALIFALIERASADDLKTWKVELLEEVLQRDPGPLASARVFLSALQQQQRPTWANLAVKSYEFLYRQAVADKLEQASRLLEEVAADEIPEWDVGARLAKALNRALKQGRWPARAALDCQDHAAFRALLAADDHAGLARRVLTGVMEDHAQAADWQVAALTRTAAERADSAWVAKQLAKAVAAVGKALGL